MNTAKNFTELVVAANIQFPGFGITEIIIGYEGFEDENEVATMSMYELPTEVREWIKAQVKIHTALKAKTIEVLTSLGFDFSQFDNETELSEIKERAIEFLQAHSSELEQDNDECEVRGNGSRQSVNYGEYWSSGEIIDWAHYYNKGLTKVEHSDFILIKDDGTPVNMVLWCWAGTDSEIE